MQVRRITPKALSFRTNSWLQGLGDAPHADWRLGATRATVLSYLKIRRSVVVQQNVGEELEELEACDVESLKTKWRALHGSDPPKGLSAKLMRRAIGFELQVWEIGRASCRERV